MNHDTSRLRHYFPIAAWVIGNVWMLLPVFGVAAIAALPFSVHYALSILSVWMGILCFWIDRRHLNYLLITPLTPVASILVMGSGLGVSFVIFDSPQKYVYGFVAYQSVLLLTFPLFLFGYWLFTRREPGFVFPRGSLAQRSAFRLPVLTIGWILILFELAKVVVGVVTGVSDRGYGGEFILDTPFGIWTAFGVFLRVQTLAFLLVPYIFRESGPSGKLLILGVVGSILLLNFVAASRGAVFFPIIILIVGSYLFLESRRVRYEPVFAAILILIIPLVTLMAHYRNTETFRETSVRDIRGRLSAVQEGLKRQKEFAEQGEKWSEAGRAFIGVVDHLVYEMTPKSLPHVGFDRLGDVIWVWVPYFLYRDRPILVDGKFIAEEYLGYELIRTAVGISWPAEMYRRFGWLGVPFGMFVYGMIYGAIYRWAFRVYHRKNAVLGFLILGVFCHFLIAWYFHTVLTNVWFWLYDMPKNLAFVVALYYGVRYIFRVSRVPGAIELARRQSIEDAAMSGSSPPRTMPQHPLFGLMAGRSVGS